MAKHLTSEDLRVYLLKTLSESRRKVAHAHLEGCADCQSALEAERKRLAVLDGLRVEEAPDGLVDRTLGGLYSGCKRHSRSSRFSGRALALAVASVVLVLGVTCLYRASVREELNHRTMLSMKQLGISLKMAANESDDGRWPALDAAGEGWTPDLKVLSHLIQGYPYILVSKSHPDSLALEREVTRALELPSPDLDVAAAIMRDNYAYLGYTMRDEAEFEVIRQAKEANGLPIEKAARSSSATGIAIQPFRDGVERFLLTDINNPAATYRAQSSIPVLIEIATWKYKKSEDDFKGTNVLYMDGHVAFVPLGTFPVLAPILDVLTGGK